MDSTRDPSRDEGRREVSLVICLPCRPLTKTNTSESTPTSPHKRCPQLVGRALSEAKGSSEPLLLIG